MLAFVPSVVYAATNTRSVFRVRGKLFLIVICTSNYPLAGATLDVSRVIATGNAAEVPCGMDWLAHAPSSKQLIVVRMCFM